MGLTTVFVKVLSGSVTLYTDFSNVGLLSFTSSIVITMVVFASLGVVPWSLA